VALPSGGEFTVVNQTSGGQLVYLSNNDITGPSIPLIPGANAHVVTGDYGIQSASGSIGGAYPLYAPQSTPSINLSYGPMLYDVLVITDDPLGDMTVPVTYVFDPQYAKSAGRWTFYNDLKQASPQTITIADTFGNSTTLPVGTAKTILYTPDGKIVVISSST
jgi:hypothetical protein